MKNKRLLTAKDPKPYRVENAAGRSKCLIICDHASNRIPARLGNLGVSKANLKKHIAWDPGTERIGRYLSKKTDSTAIFSTFSRLVVDVNRGEKSAECIREVYDHIAVPANKALPKAERQKRIDEIYKPYHAAIDRTVGAYLKKKKVPLLLSVHSFTPRMDGFNRPWHIGILWNREAVIAKKLVKELRRQNPRLIVGENQPYSLKAKNLGKNTISTHAEERGLPYIIVEFRQDLVSTKAGAEKWAKLFLKSLAPILSDPAVYKKRNKQ